MTNPEEVDFDFQNEPHLEVRSMRATKLTNEASGKAVEDSLEAKISGDWYNIPFPDMPLMSKTLALVPGAVFGMCGGSKLGKSFLILEWVWRWLMDGVDVSMMALESGCRFHADRMAAQMTQMSAFINPVELQNPETAAKARAALAEWRDWIYYIAPSIQDMSDNPQTVGNVLAWMERELEGEGPTGRKAKIVIVDPVTAVAPDRGQRFADHTRLVLEADRLARRTGGRVILSTHPIRSKSSFKKEAPSLDRIANGQCYGQFCSAVGWIDYAGHARAKCDTCKGKGTWQDVLAKATCTICKGTGKSQIKSTANRAFHWLAVRNAPNPGVIDMNFNGGSLTYSELAPDAEQQGMF